MKLLIHRHDAAPLEVEGDRVRILVGRDHFEMREQDGLLVRIEEHDGGLAMHLALFPAGANSVRLKGGLR
jgi:hypothetical protein